ncbi:hypothetical protein PG985_016200 [Apiospora marii]|uniref:uncharacterized protein n=1 Tax=Apiospora marii TaxID=335849 RepID=UPI003131BC2B
MSDNKGSDGLKEEQKKEEQKKEEQKKEKQKKEEKQRNHDDTIPIDQVMSDDAIQTISISPELSDHVSTLSSVEINDEIAQPRPIKQSQGAKPKDVRVFAIEWPQPFNSVFDQAFKEVLHEAIYRQGCAP